MTTVQASLYDTKKQSVGTIELDRSVFAGPVKEHLFYEVVNMQLANRRAGTRKAKRVSDVQGTRKKPFKQKGTGNARHGTLRAVGMVKGGVAHPPEPKDFSYQMPKKMVEGALRSALSLRNGQTALFVMKGWSPSKPSTKAAAQVFETFGGKSALVIGSKTDVGLARSVRNLPHAKFLPVEAINVYDILHYDQLFLTDTVIETLTNRLKRAPSRKERESAGATAAA